MASSITLVLWPFKTTAQAQALACALTQASSACRTLTFKITDNVRAWILSVVIWCFIRNEIMAGWAAENKAYSFTQWSLGLTVSSKYSGRFYGYTLMFSIYFETCCTY